MAECKDCGKKIGFMNTIGGKCADCYYSAEEEEKVVEKIALNVRIEAIEAILLTTETAPNLNIKSRVGIIMADADCAFDVAMVKNKDALLSKLKSEAHSIGANAVVGVTFNMIETYSASIGIGKVNTFKLIAYGTAVIIETDEGVL